MSFEFKGKVLAEGTILGVTGDDGTTDHGLR